MSIAGAAPFSLQSPEAIAKQYEGNKQKIAHAVQLGLVDPTAGTLAGMFIDRMRAAATQERGTPPTVAQQVLGAGPSGAPAPPPGGPPPPQGLGALHPTPPAPMGAPPPQGMPMPMGGPPVRAADGGLMSIPIPDSMFDEPDNASMARGGLVAFAQGGDAEGDNPDITSIISQDDGGGGDLSVPEQLSGLFGYMYPEATFATAKKKTKDLASAAQQTKAARGLGKLWDTGAGATEAVANAYGAGASGVAGARPLVQAVQAVRGGKPATTAGGNPLADFWHNLTTGTHSATPRATPPPATADPLAAARAYIAQNGNAPPPGMPGLGGGSISTRQQGGLGGGLGAAPPPPRPIAGPPVASLDDTVGNVHRLLMDKDTTDMFAGQADKMSKQKKEDLWTSLAQIGFGMAASKNPYFLGAVGEAGNAAMPGMQAALTARRAAEADMAKQKLGLHQSEVSTGTALYNAQSQLANDRAIVDATNQLGYTRILSDRDIAKFNAMTQERIAGAKTAQQSFMERMLANVMPGILRDPEFVKGYIDPNTKKVDVDRLHSAAYLKALGAIAGEQQTGKHPDPNASLEAALGGTGGNDGYDPSKVRRVP